MPRETPQIRILDSPEALAKARADAAAYASSHPPEAISLDHMGRSMLDANYLEKLARAGEPLRERLRVLAAGTGAPAVAASACLVRLGESGYATRLSQLLASETSPVLGECFHWIGINGELVRQLPDLDTLRQHVEPIAQSPDHPDRLPALRAAFELETRLASVEIVETLVQAAGTTRFPEGWISYALGRMARRGGDPGLAAARALMQPPFLGHSSIGRVRSQDPRLVTDLERLIGSEAKKQTIDDAMLALAYVQGMEAMPRLLAALEDSEYSVVPKAVGVAAEGTGDESIVAALSMAAAGRRHSGLAVAIARVGGPLAMRTVAGLCTRVNVFDAMAAAWRAKGITASSAIRRFVDAGVIQAMPTDDELRAAAESPYAWEPDDLWLFLHFLDKSGRAPDATGEDIYATDAAQHPRMIERFAPAAGAMLPIEHLSQIDGQKDDRGEQEVDIQFVCGSRVYQVTTKVNGRYFNFAAVRALLNGALEDRGCEERFTRMQQLDTERLIFGPQAAVEAACENIYLSYGTERTEHTAWLDRMQQMFIDAAGPTPRASEAIDFGFHIITPTRAGTFPHGVLIELNEAVAGTLGRATPVTVTAGAGWTEITVRITRDQFTAAGAEAIEALFVAVCDLTEAHLGRTLSGSDWARINEGELAGAIDAIDWLQYFGPRFGKASRARPKGLTIRQSPRGAEVLKVDMDPLAPLWLPRKRGARDASIRLRPFPESAQAELDPEVRLKKVSPPEPVAWKPDERQAMLRARAGTLQGIEKGMANGRLFDRFRRRYLAEELDSARLDRIATWFSYYGSAAATAAFRVVSRLHDTHPAAAPMDDDALEGCVKLIAWSGEDRPLLERELLIEHIVDLTDPGMAIFAKQMYEPDAVGGLIKMTAMQVAVCKCERCTETRKILERDKGGLT